MKILTGIDVPFQPFGGSLLVADDWYSNLPDDVEVRFLTLQPPAGQEKWWNIKDVVFLDIEKTRDPAGYMDYVSKLKELVEQQIDDFKPDVIHCQHLNYGLSRAIAEIETGIPRIGVCHGTDVQIATSIPFFKENLVRICDQMDLLLFPNQTMTDDFFAVYGKEKAYEINPLGIPDKFFDAVPRTLTYDGTRPLELLYAGRLLAWKGPDIAVESMQYVTHDVNLTVIGNEDQAGFKQQMLEFVRQNGLSDRVAFHDQLPREQLLDKFSKYDVIIFPSRSLEAFSLTVVEAQAKGIPVVFNPGGGITDTAGDGGIRITDNSAQGVARLLDEICQDPDLLRKVQTRGYQNAEKFRTSISQKNLFALSQELITRRAG